MGIQIYSAMDIGFVCEDFQLDADIRDRWINVLRSGKYEQNHGDWFTRDGRVCALEAYLRDMHGSSKMNAEYRTRLLNQIPDGLKKAVIAMNDALKWSFDEIAGWLEVHTRPVPPKNWARDVLEPSLLKTFDKCPIPFYEVRKEKEYATLAE